MSLPLQDDRASHRVGPIARIAEDFNPGVTLLVLLWTAAFALRERLSRLGELNELGDDALRSLVYVIPIMLVGWGFLAFADRRFRLGLFNKTPDR